jgi:hypothetical protein
MRAREGGDRPDPAPTIQARRDLDDVLRRALHAAVDPVEPAGDGLTRIVHRLSTPSAMRQATLLVTDCVDLARLITIWLEPAFAGVMRLRRRQHAGCRREFPHRATRPTGPRPRPALAAASAATIVVIAVLILGPVRQIVARTSLSAGTGASSPAHTGGHSPGGGNGQSPTTNLTQAGPTRSGTPSGSASARARRTSHPPATTPAPSPAVTPSGSSTASPSQSPGPTPTPSKTNHRHHKPHPRKTNSPGTGDATA